MEVTDKIIGLGIGLGGGWAFFSLLFGTALLAMRACFPASEEARLEGMKHPSRVVADMYKAGALVSTIIIGVAAMIAFPIVLWVL